MHYFLQGTSVKSLNLSNVEYNYGGIIKCHHIFITPLKLKQFLIEFPWYVLYLENDIRERI